MEIVKAVSLQVRILVMDEPSSILTERESEELFRLITRLKADGMAIIYISHRLGEIDRVCDRVTVMRDGQHRQDPRGIRSFPGGAGQRNGRPRGRPDFPAPANPLDEVVLETRSVTRRPRFQRVSLQVRRGEIVGLAGLVGAGRSDLARAIFGADGIDEGEIWFENRRLHRHTPDQAIRRGMGLLTEDRKSLGLLLNMTVRENITLARLARVSRALFVSRARERNQIVPLVQSLRIKTPSVEQRVSRLSGGNQQKDNRRALAVYREPVPDLRRAHTRNRCRGQNRDLPAHRQPRGAGPQHSGYLFGVAGDSRFLPPNLRHAGRRNYRRIHRSMRIPGITAGRSDGNWNR